MFYSVQTLPGNHRRCACSNSEGIQEHSKIRIWWFHQLCVTIEPCKVSTNILLDSQRLGGWLRICSELHRPFVDHQSAIHHWLFSETHPQLMLDLFFVDGFDASVHVSEEASNARFAVPWALMMAVIASSILGWGKYGFLQRLSGPSSLRRTSRYQRSFGIQHGNGHGVNSDKPHRATHGRSTLQSTSTIKKYADAYHLARSCSTALVEKVPWLSGL